MAKTQLDYLRELLSRLSANSDGRPAILYFFAQPERIGELSHTCFLLKNLYSPADYQLFIAHPQIISKARYFSRPAYDICTRDITILEARNEEEDQVYTVRSHENPVQTINFQGIAVTMLLGGAFFLETNWLKANIERDRASEIRPYILTDTEEERGQVLERRLGIDPKAPLVVLHVREHKLLGLDFCHHRNSDIANYEESLKLLTRRGYMVVRIGDPLCKPLSVPIDGVFDTTSTPNYDRIGDPYFISRCSFMYHTASGPSSLALGFRKPALASNTPLGHTHIVRDELMVYKEYRSRATGKPMSMREIYEGGLFDMAHDADFEAAGCELVENDPDLLVDAVTEMIGYVEKTAPPSADLQSARASFNRFGQNLHEQRKEDPALVAQLRGGCWLAYPGTRLSGAFLDRYPDFLDGL